MKALVLALLLAALPAGALAQSPPPGLDDLVERTMATFKVPGVSLAIVKDGNVVVARGYGVRTAGRPERMDERTVIGIASNTKAFTAVAIAMLVEQGKLEWDAPVTKYLPWFRLGDAYLTRELTVRDLLVHRSGLATGAGDLLLFPPTTYSRSEIVRRLAELPPSTGLRSHYAYANVLYVTAAELIEAVSGLTWERFVDERILARAWMAASRASPAQAAKAANFASPHGEFDGKVRPIPTIASEAANPAGGIYSTAEDMARWLQVLLANGRLPGGGALYGPDTARELLALQTPMPIGRVNEGLEPLAANFRGYALGFIVQDYRGRKMAWHTGGLPGMVSRVTLFPGESLGIAVMTNQEPAEAFNAITLAIADHYLGAAPHDWVAAFDKVRGLPGNGAGGGGSAPGAAAREAAGKDPASRTAPPADRYAGLYRDPWYGDVEVAKEGAGLRLRMKPTPGLEGSLEHWQDDTFIVRWSDRLLRADAYVSFALDAEGRVREARMKPVSEDAGFTFDFHDLRLKPVPLAR